MIFNPRGLSGEAFSGCKFCIDDRILTIANSYVYLGLVFKPSGTVAAAIEELNSKASKAWFAVSNVYNWLTLWLCLLVYMDVSFGLLSLFQ